MDKDKNSSLVTGCLTSASVKVIAQSVGVSNLNDASLQYVAEEMTFRLRHMIQDAKKFMEHGKRRKLCTSDMDHALKLHNVEPLYGFHANEFVPFRHASGGGRDIFFVEEKDIDLSEIISSAPPKVPQEVSIRAHWLAIDGEQPAVPENPPQVSRDVQRLESHDPSVKSASRTAGNVGDVTTRPKVKMSDKLRMKELTTHELSIEQQLYYKEITEACVGSDETRRSEALQSLTSDPGLYQMLPHFSTFISEGVKVNVTQNNLALLIYLMRMVKSLMDNPTIYLEKYLHEFIPALLSCIISRQLCMRPDIDNHWALRDFAARLLAQLCKTFTTSTNMIQTRITKMLSSALQTDSAPLATHYGAIVGIGELGTEVVKAFVLPLVRLESDRLQTVLEGPLGNSTDRIAADHVKHALLKLIPPVLKITRQPNDTVDEYRTAYGYLGPALHSAVAKLRQTTGTATSLSTSTSNFLSGRPTGGLSLIQASKGPQLALQPALMAAAQRVSPQPRTPVQLASLTSSTSQKFVLRQTSAQHPTASAAKIVVVSVPSSVDSATRAVFVTTSTGPMARTESSLNDGSGPFQ